MLPREREVEDNINIFNNINFIINVDVIKININSWSGRGRCRRRTGWSQPARRSRWWRSWPWWWWPWCCWWSVWWQWQPVRHLRWQFQMLEKMVFLMNDVDVDISLQNLAHNKFCPGWLEQWVQGICGPPCSASLWWRFASPSSSSSSRAAPSAAKDSEIFFLIIFFF